MSKHEEPACRAPTGRAGVNRAVRLILGVGAGMGVAVVAALALAILDLYLTGHGHPSINRATISVPWTGIRLSTADIALLASALVAGVATWFLLGAIVKERRGDDG